MYLTENIATALGFENDPAACEKCAASRFGRRLPSDWIKRDFPGSTRYRRFDTNPWTTESRIEKRTRHRLSRRASLSLSLSIPFFTSASFWREFTDPRSSRTKRAYAPHRQKLVWKLLSVDLWYINSDISRKISYFTWTIKRQLRSHQQRWCMLKFLFHALPRLLQDD